MGNQAKAKTRKVETVEAARACDGRRSCTESLSTP